jgi:soluble lytic murein transglycosylase-like protein
VTAAVADPDPPPPPPVTGIVWRPEVERWRGLVDRYFTGQGESQRALAIIRCESVGDPDAVNPTSGTAGLFQHRPRYWAARSAAAGWAGADVYDPEANVAVAAWLVHTSGWQHWSGRAWGVDSCLEYAIAQGV